MGIGYPPHSLGALFRLGGLLRGVSPHRNDDIQALLEANARLRALAVKLSNLLGDLPSTAMTTTDEAAPLTLEPGDQASAPRTAF